jgi:uncharacterized protein YraI
MNVIKPTANVISLTTSNSVSNAAVVFISANATAQVNLYSSAGTQYASFVLPANQYIYVQKQVPTDLLTSNVAVFATVAGYRG